MVFSSVIYKTTEETFAEEDGSSCMGTQRYLSGRREGAGVVKGEQFVLELRPYIVMNFRRHGYPT